MSREIPHETREKLFREKQISMLFILFSLAQRRESLQRGSDKYLKSHLKK